MDEMMRLPNHSASFVDVDEHYAKTATSVPCGCAFRNIALGARWRR